MTTQEEFKVELTEIFRKMDQSIKPRLLGGFGEGHSMHSDAKSAAPEWLQRWDDDNRWLICFTQGLEGLLVMAEAFGHSREEFLRILMGYRDGHSAPEEVY